MIKTPLQVLQLRGIDYTDWITPILEARNTMQKDIVMKIVAKHHDWDMDDILFKGAEVLRKKNDDAREIMNRPLPPLTVQGVAVQAHWAASYHFQPCILLLETVELKRFVTVGPLMSTTDAATKNEADLMTVCLRLGFKLDGATMFASKPIELEEEIVEVFVDKWNYHAVDPSSALFRDYVTPVQQSMDAEVEAFLAKNASGDDTEEICGEDTVE